jgi:hypothetical protein
MTPWDAWAEWLLLEGLAFEVETGQGAYVQILE